MSEDSRNDTQESDPFAELDAGDDADETDPFDELDGGSETEAGDDGPESERNSVKTDLGTADPSSSTSSSSEVEDPFDELDEVDEELAEEAFERMEVGELEEEDVWETLSADEASAAADSAVGAGAGETATEHVVDKLEYCQRCPHFTEPPEVACTHEDGEILEVLSGDEFRVRGCPMVGEEGPAFDRGK